MLISVYMTVKDGERFLSEAIESVTAQTYKDWELVVVDDGSQDSSREILEFYSKADSRIKLIASAPIGRGKALNLALQECSGKYVCNLDADDRFLPEKLEKQLAFMVDNDLSFSCTMGRLIDCFGGPLSSVVSASKNLDINRSLFYKNVISHITIMVDREVFESIGFYDDRRKSQFDYDAYLRLAKCGVVMRRLDEVLSEKRLHDSQSFEVGGRLKYVARGLALKLAYLPYSERKFYTLFYSIASAVYSLLPRGFKVRGRSD